MAQVKNIVLDLKFRTEQAQRSSTQFANSLDNIERELKEATVGTLKYVEAQNRLAQSTGQANRQIQNTNATIGATEKKVNSLSGTIGGARSALLQFGAIAGVGFGLNQVIGTITEFDQSLADLQAITGLDGASGDFEFLTQKAREFGRTTTVSASEAVEAFKLIGSAKPDLLQNSEGLAEVSRQAIILSEASGLALPEAAANLGQALNSLNLPASEAGKLVDVLAVAAQRGTREIPFLTEAFSKFGGVAANAGVSIQDSAAATEILGAKIPEAATAGTNLRNILVILQTQASKQGRSFLGLRKELDLLGPKLEDVAFLEKTFGRENILAAQTLIAQREELANFSDQLDVTGAAQKQAETRTDTLQGAFQRLKNAFQDFILGASESTNGFKNIINFLARNLGTILTVLAKAVKLFLIYKAAVIAANVATRAYTFVTGGLALATGRVTAGNIQAAKSFKALFTTMKLNPFGLVVTGVSVLVGALWDLFDAQSAVEEQQEKVNKVFGAFSKEINKEKAKVMERVKAINDAAEAEAQILESQGKDASKIREKAAQEQQKILEDASARALTEKQKLEKLLVGAEKKLQKTVAEVTEKGLTGNQGPLFDELRDRILVDDRARVESLKKTIALLTETEKEFGKTQNEIATASAVTRNNITREMTEKERAAARERLKFELDLQNELRKLKERERELRLDSESGVSEQERLKRRLALENEAIDNEIDARIKSAKEEGKLSLQAQADFERIRAQLKINAAIETQNKITEIEKAAEKKRQENLFKISQLDKDFELFDLETELTDLNNEREKLQKQFDLARSQSEQQQIQRDLDNNLILIENALTERFEAEKSKIIANRDKLLQEENLTEEEKILIKKQADLEILQAEAKLQQDLTQLEQDAEEERKQQRRQRLMTILDGYSQIFSETVKLLNTVVDIQIKELDHLINAQQKAVDNARNIAEKGNAELLELEEKRLAELQKKREAFVRRQQALAVIELAANSAIAIAKAAAQGGVAAPFTIAATLIALTAGIAQAVAAARAASFGTFAKGGYTGDGMHRDHTGERVAGVVHEKEFVFDKHFVAKGKNRSILERMHRGRMDLSKEMEKRNTYISMSGGITKEEMQRVMDNSIQKIPRTQFRINKHGIYAISQSIGFKKDRLKNRIA